MLGFATEKDLKEWLVEIAVPIEALLIASDESDFCPELKTALLEARDKIREKLTY